MNTKFIYFITITLGLCAFAQSVLSDQNSKVYIPIPSYRVGPYAAGGSGYFGGKIDYFNLLNMHNGGVNGVKVTWSECETKYKVARGIECYHRMKYRNGGALYFDSLSVGINSALMKSARRDHIPLVLPDGGKTDCQIGAIYPWCFNLGINTYDVASIAIKYMSRLESGDVNRPTRPEDGYLKNKIIVSLYHGSPYGREANSFIDSLAKKWGFKHIKIEVTPPGIQQSSAWLQIRKTKPDYVYLRGWGAMNPVALKTAATQGYPASHIIGNIWSSSNQDVIPAGNAADGYQGITTVSTGVKYPVIQKIKKYVYKNGKGNLNDMSRMGSVYWNLGVSSAIYQIEAIRVAQQRFGNRAITSEEYRWGLENLKLNEFDLKRLGAKGLTPPIDVSCSDHTGGHVAKIRKWNARAKTWLAITGWMRGNPKLYLPMLKDEASKYATTNNIKRRDCQDPQERNEYALRK